MESPVIPTCPKCGSKNTREVVRTRLRIFYDCLACLATFAIYLL